MYPHGTYSRGFGDCCGEKNLWFNSIGVCEEGDAVLAGTGGGGFDG